MSEETSAASTPENEQRWKSWLAWGVKIAVTVGAFIYIGSIVELDELTASLSRVSALAMLGACAASVINICVGAVRWRYLLSAYGAPSRPPLRRMIRLYWVGLFYNTYLPGGVGGDVVRGVVTRDSFGEAGAASSVTVVFVERVLGLTGLLLLVATTYLIRPLEGTDGILPFCLLGLVMAGAAVSAVAAARRIAPRLPGPLGRFAARLPAIVDHGPFSLALLLSLLTQALAAVTGWCFLASISDGAITLPDALVVVPLGMAAAFFPLSIGGAGVREGAFIWLCTSAFSMSRSDALAVSLLIWVSQLLVALPGGLAQLIAPLSVPSTSDAPTP